MQGNREKEGKVSSSTKIFRKIKTAISHEDTVKASRSLTRGSLSFFAAFFFARCPLLFSSYPLGIAFLCAAKYDLLYALCGAILGALTLEKYHAVYICAYAFISLLRFFINFITNRPRREDRTRLSDKTAAAFADKLTKYASYAHLKKFFFVKSDPSDEKALFDEPHVSFCDTYSSRSLLAAASSAFIGICTFILGGFAFYDVFALIFATVFSTAATFLFSFLYEKHVLRARVARELSILTFLPLLVFACRDLYALAISLGTLVAFSSLLFVCKRRSFLLALTYAALLGCALSPKLTLFFILAALTAIVFGALFGRNSIFISGAAILFGVAITSAKIRFIGGIVAVFLSAMAYLIIEGELPVKKPQATLSQRLAHHKKKSRNAAAKSNIALGNMIVSQSRVESTEQKLKVLSESFEGLSEMFFNLSDKLRRPAMLDLRKICDVAFEPRCQNCSQKDVCRGLEYGTTLEVINRLASKLHTRGYVESEDFPQYLRSRCREVDGITDSINSDCARLTEEMLRGERNEIFALDYSAISKILTDALESERESYRSDFAIGTKIYSYLREHGYTVESAVFITGIRKRIILGGIKSEEIEYDIGEIKKALSQICATELCAPTFEVRGSAEYAYFTAQKKIKVEHCTLRACAKGEDVCGDSTRVFTTEKDITFSLISDGMGSGKNAALTSGICAVFLEKMLSAGNRSKTSIRMLGNLLRSRASSSALECSCSVDLVEIDLIAASVAFTKYGAAPSFVVRNSRIYKIEADTAPIGILEAPDAHVTRFALKENDVIVMVSDGAISDMNDAAFIDFLSQNASGGVSVERLCELIMANAKIFGSKDDVSCTVLRVCKN